MQEDSAILEVQRKTRNDAGISRAAAVSAFIPFYH